MLNSGSKLYYFHKQLGCDVINPVEEILSFQPLSGNLVLFGVLWVLFTGMVLNTRKISKTELRMSVASRSGSRQRLMRSLD